MAVPSTCPSCGTSYHLADDLRGKHVQCRHCQESFLVGGPDRPRARPEDDEDDRPRRRRDEDDYDGRDRPRRRRREADDGGAGKMALIIVGAAGAVVLLVLVSCGGMVWYTSRQAGKAVDRTIEDIKKQSQSVNPPKGKVRQPVNVDDALTLLNSADAAQRLEAVRWLGTQPRDPAKRQQVLDALKPLESDQDFFVRGQALHVRNVWQGP